MICTEDKISIGYEIRRSMTQESIATELIKSSESSNYPPHHQSSIAMWPFTSSSKASTSQTVAADLNPTPGPSTQATTTPIPPTPVNNGRLNIPSGNSPISPTVINVEGEKLTGDKWTDYKAAFEVRGLIE